MPDVPNTDSSNWITMQYDYDSSMRMITPGKDPETDGYPVKPGIIRNDEANIYISAGWDAGRGKPIWGKIPIQPTHDYVITKQTFDSTTGYSGSSSWVTGITAATSSNYQSNTLNKYSPPYIAELSGNYINYVYGLFWTSGTTGTELSSRVSNLKTILANKKLPSITVGGALFTASKVIIYKKNSVIDRSFELETIYDVCFNKIISTSTTNKYVVVRIVETKTTATAIPQYKWDVYFDDGQYLRNTIIRQYCRNYTTTGMYPNDYFRTANMPAALQWQQTVLTPMTDSGKQYISGYGVGAAGNVNAHTQINTRGGVVCMHSPGLCCWFESNGAWFPIRQLHARNNSYTGKSIYVGGMQSWIPVYNTIIEFQNSTTGELMMVTLRRSDLYTLQQLGTGVSGQSLTWVPTVDSTVIYKEI